jgi:hypothetical protein
MIRKVLMLSYAVVAYGVAIASLAYIMGFLADVAVPKGISDGPAKPLWLACLIDVGLVGLFGLHHSVTARTSFKRLWTKLIPAPIERATYLYMTSAMTALLVVWWQPVPIVVWDVDTPTLAVGIRAIYLAVWVVMAAATFQFGHFSFFGLTQVWDRIRNAPARRSTFTARYLYALVRHPISLCWMLAPLLTPHLTVGHVVFAVSTFAYVLLATPFEEADLLEALGEPYVEYRKRTPRFLPVPK